MRIVALLFALFSLSFSWDLLCIVGKKGNKWYNVEVQETFHCSYDVLEKNAVEKSKKGDLFIFKMPDGRVMYCESDWVWSFRNFVIFGRDNFSEKFCEEK